MSDFLTPPPRVSQTFFIDAPLANSQLHEMSKTRKVRKFKPSTLLSRLFYPIDNNFSWQCMSADELNVDELYSLLDKTEAIVSKEKLYDI